MPNSFSKALSPIVLPDADGQPHRLGAFWERQPAAVVFLRHYGWIFCREQVAQLREHRQANLVAIGLGDRNYARLFREETRIEFPLLIDEDRQAYRAAGLRSANILHLLRSDNAKARKRAQAAGHKQVRLGQNPFQLGGSFVFGPGNVDRYVYVSQTFGDNAPPDALLAAL